MAEGVCLETADKSATSRHDADEINASGERSQKAAEPWWLMFAFIGAVLLLIGVVLAIASRITKDPSATVADALLLRPSAAEHALAVERVAKNILDRCIAVQKLCKESKKAARGANDYSSTLVVNLNEHVQSVAAIDTQQCPRDFRDAVAEHIQAVKGFVEVVESVPDLDWLDMASGLEGLLGGLAGSGQSRRRTEFGQRWRDANKRRIDAEANIFETAKKYGYEHAARH